MSIEIVDQHGNMPESNCDSDLDVVRPLTRLEGVFFGSLWWFFIAGAIGTIAFYITREDFLVLVSMSLYMVNIFGVLLKYFRLHVH